MNTNYFDHASTTPVDPEVLEAMLPYLTENFGNPSSITHREGMQAKEALEHAREQVANLISAETHEILFTSGATEATNICVLGMAHYLASNQLDIASTNIEHKSVSEPIKELANRAGVALHTMEADSNGLIPPNSVDSVFIKNSIGFVSMQWANSEVGVIQELPRVSTIVRSHGAWIHTDATQAIASLEINVGECPIDFLSFSGHKIQAPKGTGVLFVSEGVNNSPLKPILFGGGQEWGFRPGTYNLPAIVGLGKACELLRMRREATAHHVDEVKAAFETEINRLIPSVQINAARVARVPSISSVSFPDVEAEAILSRVPDVAISFGAACDSGTIEPSSVLIAMGVDRRTAYRTLRFSFGRFTQPESVRQLASRIAEVHDSLSALS